MGGEGTNERALFSGIIRDGRGIKVDGGNGGEKRRDSKCFVMAVRERPSSPSDWRINHTLFSFFLIFTPDAECKSEVTMPNALVNNPGSLNTIHS